jgi:hypothetical protein
VWIYLWLTASYLASASFPLLSPVARNLEYEYALMAGQFVIFLVPIVAFLIPRENIPEKNGQYTVATAFDTLWIMLVAPAVFLLVPLLFYLIEFCPCSTSGTLFWTAVQVLPNLIIAHAVYHGILWARSNGYQRHKIGAFILIVYAVLILIALATMWFAPQKRVVSMLMGFLHGPVYDAWIAVDNGIVAARVAHIFVAFALMSLFRHVSHWARFGTAVVFTALASATYVYAVSQPSMGNSAGALNSLMRGKVQSGKVIVRFRAAREEQAPPPIVRRILAEALFHVQDLEKALGKPERPVVIYVYPNRETKKLWFGAGDTDVTDVRSPSVHITQAGWPHPTLRHELVHALTSSYGFWGLGFHPNMAITEGLAVALDPEDSDLTLDEQVAAMLHTKKLPDIERLFGPLFWLESGMRSYAVAGSLLKFMQKKYGSEAVRKLYSGSSWSSAFKSSKTDVLRAWQASVVKVYNKERFSAYAQSQFRADGLIDAVCPHSIADLARSRSENTWLRLRQPMGWDPNTNYWPWRLSLNPEDESVRLGFWRREISSIARQRMMLTGRLQTWAEVVARGRKWEPDSLEGVELAILESDVRALLGEREASRAILDQIVEFSKQKQLGRGLLRKVESRLFVQEHLPVDAVVAWRKYLAGWGTIPTPTVDDPWLLNYLRVRMLDYPIDSKDILRQLLSLPLPKGFDPSFYVEWYLHLAKRFLRMDDFALAKAAIERASKFTGKAGKEYYQMLSRQVAFFNALPEDLRP